MTCEQMNLDELLNAWRRTFDNELRGEMCDHWPTAKREIETARNLRRSIRDELAHRCGEQAKMVQQ